MQFSDVARSTRQIISLEFEDRDLDIQASVSSIKQDMLNRGVYHSTMTAQSFSAFFNAEFQQRINSIAERFLWALRSEGASAEADGTAAGHALFRVLAQEQLTRLLTSYDSYTEPVVKPLQGDHPRQIREQLVERMANYLRRTDLAVELEYKASVTAQKEVLVLRPTIYGVGIDLKELWRRFF